MIWRVLAGTIAAAVLAVVTYCETIVTLVRVGRGEGLPVLMNAPPSIRSLRNEALFVRPAQLLAKRQQVRRDALAVLADDPLDAVALRQYAIVEGLTQPEQARSPLRLAERLTRRELSTQFGLIELAVADGDVKGALRHYDRAMTTHPESQRVLLRVLAPAGNDPEVRAELAHYAGRPWFSPLLGEALGLSMTAEAAAQLWQQSRLALGVAETARLRKALLGQVLDRGDRAAALILLARDAAGDTALYQAGFTPGALDPALSPLTWRLVNDEAIHSSVTATGELVVEIAPERGGVIAERVTLLGPGSYHLRLEQEPPVAGPVAQLTWQIVCRGRGTQAPLLKATIQRGQSPVDLSFLVGNDCPVQRWQLGGVGETALDPSRVQVGAVQLSRYST